MPDGGASIWLPMIIGAGVSTAGSVYAAHAAGGAADTQAAAGEKALAFEKSMYNDAVARTTPFVNNGTNANNALAKLMGLGTGGPLGGQPNAPAPAAPPGASTQPPVVDMRSPVMDNAQWNPLDALMSTPSGPTPAPPAGPFGASAPPVANTLSAAGDGMVAMVSPDGSPQSVPRSQVAFYQRRGATIAPGAGASA